MFYRLRGGGGPARTAPKGWPFGTPFNACGQEVDDTLQVRCAVMYCSQIAGGVGAGLPQGGAKASD